MVKSAAEYKLRSGQTYWEVHKGIYW